MVLVKIGQGSDLFPVISPEAATKTIYLLSGPTSGGKTEKALAWAEKNQAWILSCDALLFYRGADIGTAKPTATEQKRVAHFGIDLVDPSESYSIERYVTYAKSIINKARHNNVPLLVTGGSGFYLASFFKPVADPFHIPDEISRQVAELEERGGLKALLQQLERKNGSLPNCIDLQNPRRVAKALERCWATGQTVESLMEKFSAGKSPFSSYDRYLYWIDRPVKELEERIHIRTGKMLTEGLVEEVRQLLDRGMKNNPTLRSAIGYREVVQYLEGNLDKTEVEKQINLHTYRLARRQIKWFRKNFAQYPAA